MWGERQRNACLHTRCTYVSACWAFGCFYLAEWMLYNVDYFKVESFSLFKSMLCSEQANARALRGHLLSLLMLLHYSSFVLSAVFTLRSLRFLFLNPSLLLFPFCPETVTVLVFALYNNLDHVLTTQGIFAFHLCASSSSTKPLQIKHVGVVRF